MRFFVSKFQKRPMYQRIKAPQCPIQQGVSKCDLLNIQNGPMHWGVVTPLCPIYRGVVFYFFDPSSPCNSRKRNTHSKNCTYNSSIKYTIAFYLCLKNFPGPRIFGRLSGVPSTKESF